MRQNPQPQVRFSSRICSGKPPRRVATQIGHIPSPAKHWGQRESCLPRGIVFYSSSLYLSYRPHSYEFSSFITCVRSLCFYANNGLAWSLRNFPESFCSLSYDLNWWTLVRWRQKDYFLSWKCRPIRLLLLSPKPPTLTFFTDSNIILYRLSHLFYFPLYTYYISTHFRHLYFRLTETMEHLINLSFGRKQRPNKLL